MRLEEQVALTFVPELVESSECRGDLDARQIFAFELG